MNWAIVTAIFAGIQTLISLAIFVKLAFFAGKMVEKVEQLEKRVDGLPCPDARCS